MKIEKEVIGLKMAVRALKPFTVFEWNGKVCVKLRDHNKNLVDIWDMEENRPDWLMPGTVVQIVAAAYTEEMTGEGKPFQNVPWGEMFYKDNVRHFKACPLQKDKEVPGELNACQVETGCFIHVDEEEPVIQARSSYHVILAKG